MDQPLGEVLVEAADADREPQAGERLPSSSPNASGRRRPQPPRLGLRGVALLLVVDHLLVEGEALMVQCVAQLVALGPQVGLVVGVGVASIGTCSLTESP